MLGKEREGFGRGEKIEEGRRRRRKEEEERSNEL